MAKFDEEHSESVLAANLESEGAAKIIIQRMSAKVGSVEKERSVSRVSTTGVVAKGTAEAEPAFEVDDVGALRLYQTFMKDEVAACDDDRSMNNIVILKKVLINELTFALSSLALDAVNGLGINLDKILRHVNQGQGRQHLHRRHLPKHELFGCHSFLLAGEWSPPAWLPI